MGPSGDVGEDLWVLIDKHLQNVCFIYVPWSIHTLSRILGGTTLKKNEHVSILVPSGLL